MTITVVTATIKTIATTPPIIAAVLSISGQVHVVSVALFSASQTSQTSDADNMMAKSWYTYTESNIRTCYTYILTSREGDKLTVSCSSCITSSNCDSVDSGALQLVYGVASASETATGALSSSVSLSPHHL